MLGLALLAASEPLAAQTGRSRVSGADLQRLADGVLALISYTVAPDVTTSSLAIDNATTANPGLTLTQLGGGFTWSRETPLYLEGNVAYARYDPVFLAGNGFEQRAVPVEWNMVSGTGGVGWDFPIADRWVLRPIFGLTVGRVASDLGAVRWWLDENASRDLEFLDGGELRAYGLGGSLMLDYERHDREAEVDLELRYTSVRLRSYGDTAAAVEGSATAETASLWTRRRVPTGWVVWDRPVRYVLEGAYSHFFGAQTEVGVDRMTSLGLGIEFDSSAYEVWATRWRAMLRYKFGPDVDGWSVGLAISF